MSTGRRWIRERLEFLAGVSGRDCLTYTMHSNHPHLVLRIRRDVVAQWSNEEVVRKWMRLFPKRCKKDGSPEVRLKTAMDMIANQQDVLAGPRKRLSDVSW
ncbi:MAG: hypothetical protein AAGJ40_04000 [Planctomycetota bacterium]